MIWIILIIVLIFIGIVAYVVMNHTGGQPVNPTVTKSSSTSPSGYLVPVTPSGYTLSGASPSFTVDTASYQFTNSVGNTINFMESPASYDTTYAQLQANREYQTLETFNDNSTGWVSVYYHRTTVNGKSASSMYLIYNHNGHLVSIQSNSPQMSAKDLENILKSATIAQ